MKVIKHLKIITKYTKSEWLRLFYTALPSFLVFALYIGVRPGLLSGETKIIKWIAICIYCFLYISFAVSQESIIKRDNKVLFKILRFSKADIFGYKIAYISLDMLFAVITASMFMVDFVISMPLPVSLLINTALHFGIIFISIFIPDVKTESRLHITIHKKHFALRNRITTYLHYTYIASENRFAIAFCLVIAMVILVAGVYYGMPYAMMIYFVLMVLSAGLIDLARLDEDNYILNLLLRRDEAKLSRTRKIHYAVEAFVFEATATALYLIAGNAGSGILNILLTALVLYIYWLIVSSEMVEYIYNYYTNIRYYSQLLTPIILAFIFPGIGLVLSVVRFVSRKLRGR